MRGGPDARGAARGENRPLDAGRAGDTDGVVKGDESPSGSAGAPMGRRTPTLKRASHVEIRVAGVAAPAAPAPAAKPATEAKAEAKAKAKPRTKAKKAAPRKKATKQKKASE